MQKCFTAFGIKLRPSSWIHKAFYSRFVKKRAEVLAVTGISFIPQESFLIPSIFEHQFLYKTFCRGSG
jgi:hypothetical protein